jgi:hypothetical protein
MSFVELLGDAREALALAESRWHAGDALMAADLLRTAQLRIEDAQQIALDGMADA